MVERAEKVAAGERLLKKDRFVAFTDSTTSVNWDLVERARALAGIKGYVTNIDAAVMDGPAVVAAYTTSTRSNALSGWPSPTSPHDRCSTASRTASRPT
jgi:hypothetical protein